MHVPRLKFNVCFKAFEAQHKNSIFTSLSYLARKLEQIQENNLKKET